MNDRLQFADRAEFRKWLTNNSNISKGIWLIFGKAGILDTLKPDEALEEALCFGWIDGQIKSVDETKYEKKFTPRSKNSKWSERNKQIAQNLMASDQMTERGIAAINSAKESGNWDIPKTEPFSEEQIANFIDELKSFEPAFSNFQKMSPSVRGTYTAHYLTAKSEDTRKRRLEQIVTRLNDNKKPM
ncbi:MAG: YdeI/OmpD-associated family protein [Armatimonadota bacterium]